MHKTYKKRLERMAKLLDDNADNPEGIRFNIHQWAGPAPGSDTDGYFPTKARIKVDCGTMACGMGLAAISGEFEEEGLSYTLTGMEGHYMLLPIFQPNGKSLDEGYNAAEALFGIDLADAEYLFSGDCYPHLLHKGAKGERYMAQRIRNYLAGDIEKKWHPNTMFDY